MLRQPAQPSRALQSLLDERVDLRVSIVMLCESVHPDEVEIDRLHRRLAEVEQRIAETQL